MERTKIITDYFKFNSNKKLFEKHLSLIRLNNTFLKVYNDMIDTILFDTR